MSLELPDINDRDCRLTRVEMWRIVGLAVGGVLVFVGIGVAKLLTISQVAEVYDADRAQIERILGEI